MNNEHTHAYVAKYKKTCHMRYFEAKYEWVGLWSIFLKNEQPEKIHNTNLTAE